MSNILRQKWASEEIYSLPVIAYWFQSYLLPDLLKYRMKAVIAFRDNFQAFATYKRRVCAANKGRDDFLW